LANSPQARKRTRQAESRRGRNASMRSMYRTYLRRVDTAVETGDKEAATAAYAEQEMTLLELLDAAGAFQNAQLSALSLRSEAWIAYYDLLRAMGGTPEVEQ